MELFKFQSFHKRLWVFVVAAFICGFALILLGVEHSEAIDAFALDGVIEDGSHYVPQEGGDLREIPAGSWWLNAILYGVGFFLVVVGMIVLFVVFYTDLVRPIQQRLNPFGKNRGL
jgi:hypothetical protein